MLFYLSIFLCIGLYLFFSLLLAQCYSPASKILQIRRKNSKFRDGISCPTVWTLQKRQSDKYYVGFFPRIPWKGYSDEKRREIWNEAFPGE
jgi:hypothetical protein